MRLSNAIPVVAGVLCIGAIAPTLLADNPHVEVNVNVKHDVSPPLWSMRASSPGAEQRREKPLRPVPQDVLVTNSPDPVVQQSVGTLSSVTKVLNFPGIGQGDYG